ncbi:MAG: DUF805 domain-containing protein [Firmicutes bacterium]|nr:DUF805 domain-containing protein [Bacillota bacterium]
MGVYKQFWYRVFDFKGVTSRKDYWIAWSINSMIILVLYFLTQPLIDLADQYLDQGKILPGLFFFIVILLIFLYVIASIIPSISMLVRRYHDANLSASFFVFNIIPVIGPLLTFFFALMPSVEKPYNKYLK